VVSYLPITTAALIGQSGTVEGGDRTTPVPPPRPGREAVLLRWVVVVVVVFVVLVAILGNFASLGERAAFVASCVLGAGLIVVRTQR